jgi:hypothetical protein
VKLVILPGQRLKVGEEWKTEGQTVTVADAYQAQVLIESGVARPK